MPRPTRDAYAAAALALLIFFVAFNLQAGWVYALDALLVGLLLAGFASTHLSVRGVAVERRMPPQAFEGDEVAVTLTVRADGSPRLRRFFLEVADAAPGLEPGSVFIPALPAAGQVSVTYRTRAARRGVHRGGEAVVASTGLSGLFWARRRAPAAGRMTVFPRYWQLGRFPLTGRPERSAAAGAASRRSGLEFYGVRDYRRGDSLRHVHWRSTARRGSLVVREFEQESPAAVTLLIDTRDHVQAGSGAQSTLEDLIRAAASIAWLATARGGRVRLIAGHGGAMLEVAGGFGQALEFLAGLQAGPAGPPAELYARAAGSSSSVIVLTPDPGAAADLARAAPDVMAVVADRASYAGGAAHADRPPPPTPPAGRAVPVCLLRKGDDIAARLEAFEPRAEAV